MPKLKIDDSEIDVEELEEAEYDDTEFTTYTGEDPPVGTVLLGYVKKAWWAYSQEKPDGSGGNPMLTVLFVAEGNTGKRAEFEGCPIWEHMVLTAGAKFKWAPFLNLMGLTIRDVKNKTQVEEDDDNVGAPITKIGKWAPGEESDDAYCRVVTGRHRFNGAWQTDAAKWLPYADEDEEEPEDEEPEAGYEEEEPEEEAAPPTRGRKRPAARPAPAAKPAARGAKGGRTATAAAKAKPGPARGKRRPAAATADDDEEPPF